MNHCQRQEKVIDRLVIRVASRRRWESFWGCRRPRRSRPLLGQVRPEGEVGGGPEDGDEEAAVAEQQQQEE